MLDYFLFLYFCCTINVSFKCHSEPFWNCSATMCLERKINLDTYHYCTYFRWYIAIYIWGHDAQPCQSQLRRPRYMERTTTMVETAEVFDSSLLLFFSDSAESRDIRLRGLPRLSRCTAGQLRRSIMLWTVSELRMLTPPALVTRSTYQDRWMQLNPMVGDIFRSFQSLNVSSFWLQTRDWNEELQTTRELPRKNLPERLLRERAIFKVLQWLSVLWCTCRTRVFKAWFFSSRSTVTLRLLQLVGQWQ